MIKQNRMLCVPMDTIIKTYTDESKWKNKWNFGAGSI
jgi:hypothetical protein